MNEKRQEEPKTKKSPRWGNEKLIYIEWSDAHTNTAGWRDEEEALAWARNTDWYICEAGWLIEETDEYLAIATALKPENEFEDKQFLNLHKIPKGWIRMKVQINKLPNK